MSAILGGGLAGLSASYYCLQNPKISSIALIEASNRLGGWIKSKQSPTGALFEQGARTVRVDGDNGKNTLRLLDRLHLSDKIIPINYIHPAASNRMIYVKDTMIMLPNNISSLFKAIPPFSQSFFKMFYKELFKPSVKLEDESVHSFVERRFGKEAADYMASAIISGIFAGDAKQLSIKSFSKNLFEVEQEYGSLSKGLLLKKLKKQKNHKENETSSMTVEVLMSNSIQKAANEHWKMWSLQGGLEVLPQTLGKTIQKLGADVRLNSPCKRLSFKNDGIEVITENKSEIFNQVISALPAWDLAKLVKNEHPKLAEELQAIPSVDVGVVNLEFKGKVLSKRAFGFLVAPIENRPILGVIFDSQLDPSNEEYTTMTVMMGGAWFDKYFKNAKEDDFLSVALSQVKEILNINDKPVAHHVSILKKCIPQYIIGHANRLERINNYITSKKLPLILCGASYDGVGVNDVIVSGKIAAEKIA